MRKLVQITFLILQLPAILWLAYALLHVIFGFIGIELPFFLDTDEVILIWGIALGSLFANLIITDVFFNGDHS